MTADTIGFVDLECDLIGDGLRLGHGLPHLGLGNVRRGDPPATFEEHPLEPDEAHAKIDAAVIVLLKEVEQCSVRDDLGSEVGPRDSTTLHRDLDGASNNVEFATLPNGGLQAIGQ